MTRERIPFPLEGPPRLMPAARILRGCEGLGVRGPGRPGGLLAGGRAGLGAPCSTVPGAARPGSRRTRSGPRPSPRRRPGAMEHE